MTRRFDTIKVGDQLCERRSAEHGLDRRQCAYFVVTDLWFDPVRGQRRRSSGEMVAIQHIQRDGQPHGDKRAHTIRGLAQAGYQIATIDYLSMAQQRVEAMREGKVIGIRRGVEIQKRYKAAPWSKPL